MIVLIVLVIGVAVYLLDALIHPEKY
ncbi:potassium-transporting ATPase subunit F [Priestia koreensis]|nr:potassium-transporting ATPase subunit F [Priestia koreensis]